MMKCERCGENEANLYIKKIFNGESYEENICSECAEKEEYDILGEMGDSMKDFCLETIMMGLSSFDNIAEIEHTEEFVKRCPQCDSTYQDILKSGFFGCPKCYEVFHEEASNILKQINGTSVHRGNVPARFRKEMDLQKKIEQKQNELEKAIQDENYEYAAILRDEIRKLKLNEQEG